VLVGLDVEAAGSASKKVSTFSDARLQAVSSRNMYSEQLCTVMPLAMKRAGDRLGEIEDLLSADRVKDLHAIEVAGDAPLRSSDS
jgi:hypothetical protein